MISSSARPWALIPATLVCSLFSLCGCRPGAEDQRPVFTLEVVIVDEPVEGVHVALFPKGARESSFVLEGITDHSGKAAMVLIDGADLSSTPTEYAVVCQSLDDWQIKKPWSDAELTPLSITWPESEQIKVELPRKAVKAL